METCCTNTCVRRSRTKPPRVTVSVGGVRLIVHANVAGEASALPAASIARTANEWRPSASAEYVTGLTHETNAASSSEHWNAATPDPLSLPVNANVAVSLLTRLG